MHLLVAGVRHRTAAIDVREKFALTEDEIERAIPFLLTLPGIMECAILTTCNRTEVYVAVTQSDVGLKSIKQFFLEFKGVQYDEYRGAVMTLLHEDAAMHLFQVASGLDSLIIGEGQILAQVKDTLAQAQALNSNGAVLDKLFKTALTVGKRVRTETGIALRDVSVSKAAYEFAKELRPDLLERPLALVGGGKMAEILLRSLRNEMTAEQRENVVIVNRSAQRLESLKEKFGFQGVTWEALPEVIASAHTLFVATGAPHIVLDETDFEGRGEKLIMDISVPRNVSPSVTALEGVSLYNTDDLAGTMGYSVESQQEIKAQARQIIHEEYAQFYHWLMSLPVVGPTITMLRSKVETIRQSEASCACPVIGTSCSMMDTLSRNLVNKILHDPTVRLKTTDNLEDIYQQAAMLSHLFNFDSLSDANPNGESGTKPADIKQAAH